MPESTLPIHQEAERQRLVEKLEEVRATLLRAAHHADQAGASRAHMRIMDTVATLDDELTALSEGVSRQ